MLMKNCSLFLAQNDVESIADYITKTFSKSKIDIKGEKSNWIQIKVTQKTGWFGLASITFSLQTETNMSGFDYVIQGMTNMITPFYNPHSEMHQDLLSQVQDSKVSISIFADSGFDLFQNNIFQIAKEFNALVLVNALYWLDNDENMLLDMSGQFTAHDRIEEAVVLQTIKFMQFMSVII
jgi:hypothetical protein